MPPLDHGDGMVAGDEVGPDGDRPGSDGHQGGEGTWPARYVIVRRDGWQAVDAAIIHEQLVSIFVNGQELATMMCTPVDLRALAVGFLANEGVIDSMDEVRALHRCPSGACIDVWLKRADFEPPRRMILTSGCGGGVTFDDLTAAHPPVTEEIHVSPDRLWDLMDALYGRAHLYSEARGVHTSAWSDGERIILAAEDVGRHNTLDKLRGKALLEGVYTRGGVILTTGRVSSEMINKARSMGVPLVCSRTSPTSLSARLADDWGITLVGYLRRNSMNVYTHPDRVLRTPSAQTVYDSPREREETTPHV
jgi:FdhD protein